MKKVLYLIVCAAPPASQTHELIAPLQEAGWDVCVIATPQATRWINIPALEQLTGHIVRTDYKLPGEAGPLPKANAILAMPVTFNTVNKWALGIGDTLAASLLCECMGRGTPPIVAVPCLKMDLVKHPAFRKNIALLQEYGVTVLHEPERYKSPLMVPLSEVLQALHVAYQTEENKEAS
ncbi:flavoprotein [Ktedonosporobacter rubrisoli]|uniref:Flavoprotein n=1 Tax=Ktedonosporobacter rubrisoli TaxID=2509675 RepID=A0A4P6JYC4_KTERU|nr:flavoprotein [Ktedonosporobacter rubrisoli]QBD80440.1 flavoprotein [Ktedonosporobacter rubrisoli]